MNQAVQNTYVVRPDLEIFSLAEPVPAPDSEPPPYRFIQALDVRLDALYRKVLATRFWSELVFPGTPTPRAKAILREIILSIHWYQIHTIEASDLMIRRLPRRKLRTLDILLKQKDGTTSGRWALNDYLALGGDQAVAGMLPPDPAVFAASSVWWHMSEVEDPWACLGAEYLFEYLSVKIAPLLLDMCAARGINCADFHFLLEHATSHLTHAQLIRDLIVETVTRFPSTEPSVMRGFDYFQQVYPLPVWETAYKRVYSDPAQNRDPWRRYLAELSQPTPFGPAPDIDRVCA